MGWRSLSMTSDMGYAKFPRGSEMRIAIMAQQTQRSTLIESEFLGEKGKSDDILNVDREGLTPMKRVFSSDLKNVVKSFPEDR